MNKNSLSLLSIILIIISQTIGIGLFLKNIPVFQINNNNPFGIILSWLIGGIVSLCIAIGTAEAALAKQKKINTVGITSWVNTLFGEKFAKYTSCAVSIFRFVPLFFILCFFFAESISLIFDFNTGNCMTYILLLTIGISFIILIWNFLSPTSMQFFTIKCSYINFVPTIISLIVAIIAICSGKGQLISEINNNSNNFNILNSLSAFPAVFFAYTGYMIIGSLVNKMDNPEKNIKLAIVYSSLVILIIYILTTLALLILPDENGNYGNVCYIFDTIIDKKYQWIGNLVMTLSLTIILFNSCLSLSIAMYNAINETINLQIMPFNQKINKLNKKHKLLGEFCCISISYVFFLIIFAIPLLITQTDGILDIASNVLAIAIFLSSGILTFSATLNIKNKKIFPIYKKINYFYFSISWIICIILTIYIIFYKELYIPLSEPNNYSNSGIWINFNILQFWTESIIFWSIMTLLIIGPLIFLKFNNLAIKQIN